MSNLINYFRNKKIKRFLLLPLPILFLFLFVYEVIPWISLIRFDRSFNTYCLGNIISLNKNKNPFSVSIGSSRVRRGIEPQLIFGKNEVENDKSLNLGLQGKSYKRTYSIIENLYKNGINPKFVVIALETKNLYLDSLVAEKQNLKNNNYREDFINEYFLEKYPTKKISKKDQKKVLKSIKNIMGREYFSTAHKYSIHRNNFINRVKLSKKIASNIRSPLSKTLFLEEPKIYSESFDLPYIFTKFVTAQRFLFVFNRAFQESYIYIKEKLTNSEKIKGLWMGDICWLERYGSRNFQDNNIAKMKPFYLDKNYPPGSNNLQILKRSWEKHNNLNVPQPKLKDLSEYSIKRIIHGFSFGIPGLEYENAILGRSNITKYDLKIIDEIRSIIESNNGKLILTSIPRIYDRYPSDNEIIQIKSLYKDFIYPPKSIFQKINLAENYADPTHLNNNGRYIFSKWLNDQLSSF